MNQFSQTCRRLLPLTSKTYAHLFFLFALCVFALIALHMIWQMRQVHEAGLRREHAVAADEIHRAAQGVFAEVQRIADFLGEADEIHQQLQDANYYTYWHNTRFKELGLPAYVKALELYDPQGQSLQNPEASALPSAIAPKSIYVRQPADHVAYVYQFWPVPARSDEQASTRLGYIGLRVDFMSVLTQLSRFNHVEPSSIRLQLPVNAQVSPSQVSTYLQFKPLTLADTQELEQVMLTALLQLGLLILGLSLFYYVMLTLLYGRPLLSLVQQLSVLGQGFSRLPAKLQQECQYVSEINTLNKALHDYQRRLDEVHTALAAENRRMAAELNVTRRIQQMVLPAADELRAVRGLDIVGYMEAAEEVGGDYYDVLQHEGRITIAIGDVTGHGLESGVLMLMVQTAVRTLLTEGITDPHRFFSTLNRTIYDNVQRMRSDKNLTLAILDYYEGHLRVAGQHEEILVIRLGGRIERIDTLDFGFMVGLEPDISAFVNYADIELQTGEGVVLYTDGITEARNAAGELYGLERLCALLSLHWQKSVTLLQQLVLADVRHHQDGAKLLDDITLLILKQQARSSNSRRPLARAQHARNAADALSEA